MLATLWPEHWLTRTSAGEQPFAAARHLLQIAADITTPTNFTTGELTALAGTLRTDPRLARAAHSSGGRITQYLAGAPELLRRFTGATPAGRAILEAAMDARRLGHGPYLPEPFLRVAAPGYLDSDDWDQHGLHGWFAAAMLALTARHRKLPGPLVRH